MILKTERLEIVPLLPDQLRLWAENLTNLEKDLNCFYQATPVEGVFLEIVKGQSEKIQKNPHDFLWHSFWFLIRKGDRVVVGSAVFKGPPNAAREVEIGYGLGENFERSGYMTEAVQAMCEWALEQEKVSHVLAETDMDGVASQRVLQRCGFVETRREDTIWWRR